MYVIAVICLVSALLPSGQSEILCPAVPTSEAVQFVMCVRNMELVDCSATCNLAPGTLAVLRCSEGFQAGNSKQKTSTCRNDGSWSNADVTCSRVIPTDYEFHGGLGYYKLHTTPANWYTAKETCDNEGGHLAIVNSYAEFAHIENIRGKRINRQQAFLGFHDQSSEGTFVTIFGKPLHTTGFTRWCPGQPDNVDNEDCGSIYYDCGFNDLPCDSLAPFFCEIDL